MSKYLFNGDFEIRASRHMLYPYFYSASGLAQWFADDVKVDEDKIYTFVWDGEDNKAKIVSHRSNHHVKFEFFPRSKAEETDPAFFELKLEENELTGSVYIKITDYSEMEDVEELMELWQGLVDNLKKTVGG